MLVHVREEEDRSAAMVQEVLPLQALPFSVQARSPQASSLFNRRFSPRVAVFSGVWKSIFGGLLGGILFICLGFGEAGNAFGDSGIGMCEIILLGEIAYLVFSMLIRKRRNAGLAYRTHQTQEGTYQGEGGGLFFMSMPAQHGQKTIQTRTKAMVNLHEYNIPRSSHSPGCPWRGAVGRVR